MISDIVAAATFGVLVVAAWRIESPLGRILDELEATRAVLETRDKVYDSDE